MECDLLLTRARVLPIRPGRHVVFPGSVAVRGTQILAVGDSRELDGTLSAAEVIDCRGMLLMPGFVDCHVHSGMGVAKAGLSGPPVATRWQAQVEPRLMAMGKDETVAAVRHSCLEFIRAGITTFADICVHGAATAEAVEKMGLRALLALRARPDIAELEAAIADMQARGGLIAPALALRSFAGSTAGGFDRIAGFAREAGLPVHASLAEMAEGPGDGRSSRPSLSDLPAERTILAHGAHAMPADRLGDGWAGAVHNPTAEGRGAAGAAAVTGLCSRGVPVGLGTEDAEASGRHDMFEEMRLAVVSSRLDEAGSPLDAWDALEMATIGGAVVLGMDGRLGSIEPGKQADLILIDLDGTHFAPLPQNCEADRIAAHLVFSAGCADVDSVLVAGRPLMRGRILADADEGRIVASARRVAERLSMTGEVA